VDIKKFKESWRGAFSDRLNLNERKQSKKWKRYLLAEYTKGVESFLSTNSEREFSNLFKVRDIQTLYVNLYEEVGVDFAKWYARSFDKFIEKNSGNESTWRTTFSRIGQTEAGDKIILVQGTAHKELKRNIGNLFKDPEFQSLGRDQQGRILQSRFKGITEYQATRIVRTEATSAANEGIMQSASDIFPKSSLIKEWISSQDGRTRAFNRGDKSDHLNMNGRKVGFDETFAVPEFGRVVQMKKPADFRSGASAHNIVNCRCSMAVYPKEGAEVNEGVSLTGIGGGVSARTSQLIGDEIVTARKPTADITSRERAREFTSKPNQAKDIKEAKDIFTNKLKEVNISVSKISVGRGISIDNMNKFINQFTELSSKYKISHLRAGSKVNLRFTGGSGYGGQVRYFDSGKLAEIDLGKGYNARSDFHKEYIKKSRSPDKQNTIFSDRGKSIVDEENLEVATLTHEFAHYIDNIDTSTLTKTFWKEIDDIRSEYSLERLKYLKERNIKKFNEINLGNYAGTSRDEFFAEGFTEYELRSNPSKYAIKIGELTKKYFGK